MKYVINVTGQTGFPHYVSGIRTFRPKRGFKKAQKVELSLRLSDAIAYADPGAARVISYLVKEKYEKGDNLEVSVEVRSVSEKDLFKAKLESK